MKKKHAGGRPPKKKEDFFPKNWKEKIFEMSAKGMSDIEIRAELCTKKGTFSLDLWYALLKRDEEFSEAVQIGKVLCQAWWEKQSRIRLYHSKGSIFETGSWYANMKNRFGWKDKTEHDVSDRAAQGIASLFRGRYESETARLAKGEDPSVVLFGKPNGKRPDGPSSGKV